MKYKKILILFFIIVGALLFYWYELRPAQIRHDCSWVQHKEDPTHWDSSLKLYQEKFDIYYEWCIKEKGLAR